MTHGKRDEAGGAFCMMTEMQKAESANHTVALKLLISCGFNTSQCGKGAVGGGSFQSLQEL